MHRLKNNLAWKEIEDWNCQNRCKSSSEQYFPDICMVYAAYNQGRVRNKEKEASEKNSCHKNWTSLFNVFGL